MRIEISDFENSGLVKISKLEVDKMVREKAKLKNSPNKVLKESPKRTNKKFVICSGLTKKGESCTRPGTNKPDGAKQFYCFRHAEDFKEFECSSDSSDSDEEVEKIEEKKEKVEKVEKVDTDTDDELSEED